MREQAAVVAAEDASTLNILLPHDYDIIWGAVCIAIIAFVFVKKVLPTFNKILDERAEKIEGGIAAGEKARAEAEALRASFEAQIAEARRSAAGVREQAQDDAAKILAEAKAQAQAEAERILATAQRQIAAEQAQAAQQLRTEVGTLATTLASRIVGEALADDARQQRVVDRFLDELEAQQAPAEATSGAAGSPAAAETTEA